MLPLLLSVTTTVLPLPFKCRSSIVQSLPNSASCRVGTAGGTVEVEVGVSPLSSMVEVTVTSGGLCCVYRARCYNVYCYSELCVHQCRLAYIYFVQQGFVELHYGSCL
jgi:hypothetical protein